MSANPTKWSNTLKQFGNLPTNCLSVFDHFVGLALKGFKSCLVKLFATFTNRNILTLYPNVAWRNSIFHMNSIQNLITFKFQFNFWHKLYNQIQSKFTIIVKIGSLNVAVAFRSGCLEVFSRKLHSEASVSVLVANS